MQSDHSDFEFYGLHIISFYVVMVVSYKRETLNININVKNLNSVEMKRIFMKVLSKLPVTGLANSWQVEELRFCLAGECSREGRAKASSEVLRLLGADQG